MSEQTTPELSSPVSFDSFKLGPNLQRGIKAMNWEEPRPIQAQTINEALQGRDIMGLAQTGTGKTAAFGLPIMEKILSTPGTGIRAMIIAPTRELATQIAEEMRSLSRFSDIRMVTIYGGVSQLNQVRAVKKGAQIVVGCPGRILDLYQQKELNFKNLETLVLDEADHMFDMGFLPTIRKIVGGLPSERQNMLFSATMPGEIRGLANDMLHQPHIVELAHSKPADTIDHRLYPVEENRKFDLLRKLLTEEGNGRAIVFTRTKYRARKLAQRLEKAGHNATSLQGNMSQAQRDRSMGGFRNGKFDIMVATDIVARGIDVSSVGLVINYDLPNVPEAYTHRIGRTGRAEQSGQACSFASLDDKNLVHAIERHLGEALQREVLPGFEGVEIPAWEPSRRGGGGRGAEGRNYRKSSPHRPGRGGGHNHYRGGAKKAGSGRARGASRG